MNIPLIETTDGILLSVHIVTRLLLLPMFSIRASVTNSLVSLTNVDRKQSPCLQFEISERLLFHFYSSRMTLNPRFRKSCAILCSVLNCFLVSLFTRSFSHIEKINSCSHSVRCSVNCLQTAKLSRANFRRRSIPIENEWVAVSLLQCFLGCSKHLQRYHFSNAYCSFQYNHPKLSCGCRVASHT